MSQLTWRDRHGRLLAPLRTVKGRRGQQAMVIETAAETIDPVRAVESGVDPAVFTDDPEGQRIAREASR